MSVICFGEILWDALPDGDELGGAPLNVAADLKNLGVDVHFISAVGDDESGNEALNALEMTGLDTGLVQVNDYPTGLVQVDLDMDGMPSYEILTDRAWDHIHLSPEIEEAVGRSSFLVIGSLIFRSDLSSKTIRSLLNNYPGKCIVDMNFRTPFYSQELADELLGYADILKINEDELNEIAAWNDIQGGHRNAVRILTEYFDLEMVILTRGSNGALIFKDQKFYEATALQVEVVNTVGAGDAFLAGVIFSLIYKKDPDEMLRIANKLGAAATASKGAIPDIHLKSIIS